MPFELLLSLERRPYIFPWQRHTFLQGAPPGYVFSTAEGNTGRHDATYGAISTISKPSFSVFIQYRKLPPHSMLWYQEINALRINIMHGKSVNKYQTTRHAFLFFVQIREGANMRWLSGHRQGARDQEPPDIEIPVKIDNPRCTFHKLRYPPWPHS